MSDGFLGRWSRRKLDTRPPQAAPEVVEPPPDLPPLESLGVTSDYRVFLQKGVSAAVQSGALRRAWESDARIAGFRGMADYDWDFNAPSYGRLWAVDDVAKLVRAVLTSPVHAPPDPDPANEVASVAALPEPETVPVPLASTVTAEPVPVDVDQASNLPRRHGRALPC